MELKVFKCHAVMPLNPEGDAHVVQTYVVAAPGPEAAHACVLQESGHAVFVTLPIEVSEVTSAVQPALLLAETTSISEREFADLRSAHQWRAGMRPYETVSAPDAYKDDHAP